jgi:glycogen(starch) synthase
MKICLLSLEYPPESHFGGIGTYTYNVAAGLARAGHTVHVVTSTRQSPGTSNDGGVCVHKVRQRNVRPSEASRLFYSFLVARAVLGAGCSFDVVQANEFRGEALCLSFMRRFPLVTRLATPFSLTEQLNGTASRRLLLDWIERAQTVRSDGVMSSTRALAQRVAASWRIELSRIHVIPNSVDVSRVARLGTGQDIPEILDGRAYAVFFGRLEERKGVHILARALPHVFEKCPGVDMVFIGSDAAYRGQSMRDYIRKTVGFLQGRLVFFDNLPQEKLFPIIRRARIAVLPSLWEAFGFVCIEAMALGCPVLATSGSGFEEIIVDGKSGCLVSPGDAELLACKMTDMLQDAGARARIAAGAEARSADFEVDRVVPRLVSYYTTIRDGCLR